MTGPDDIRDDDLHAYADGRLAHGRGAAVETWLAEHPERAAEVAAWERQNDAIRALFDPILAEPVPHRLTPAALARRRWWVVGRQAVAAVLLVGLGVVGGWALRGALTAPTHPELAWLPREAGLAYTVYTPERRHAVEVGPDEQAHLTGWLSKRIDHPFKVPDLSSEGYRLVGGRLTTSPSGPAALLMFEHTDGDRITLFMARAGAQAPVDLQVVKGDGVNTVYWSDDAIGYAMSGRLNTTTLARLCRLAEAQLDQL